MPPNDCFGTQGLDRYPAYQRPGSERWHTKLIEAYPNVTPTRRPRETPHVPAHPTAHRRVGTFNAGCSRRYPVSEIPRRPGDGAAHDAAVLSVQNARERDHRARARV